MKKIEYILGVGISLMISGCMGTPTVKKHTMQTVKLTNGKSYSVPVGSVYAQSPVAPQAIQFYQVMGVSYCKNGDITWEDPSISARIKKIMRSGTKQEGIEMYVDAAKIGEIGCASPLQ